MAARSIYYIKGPLEVRFWAKVDKRADNECWPWLASTINGYGIINDGVSKCRRATHVSLLLDGRPRPDALDALHSCDNPICVNPGHLRWGNDKQNKADSVSRNRHFRGVGETHPSVILTEQDVLDIRASSMNGAELGRKYGVCKENIYRILKRETWRHI